MPKSYQANELTGIIKINEGNCKGCDTCKSFCPADAITGVSADGLSGDAALYTLGGILLQKGASVNEARLPSGVYILKENGKTRKVVVR